MRIPIPERFRPRDVLLGTAALFVLQMLAGTDLIFALLTGLFIWLWTMAIHIAGGATYTSGGFIFFNGLFTVVLGLVVKAFFFEPGDRNLMSPKLTMLCYCIAMAGLVVAATVTRGLRSFRPLLKDYDSLEQLRRASITCVAVMVLTSFLPGSGAFITAFRQVNQFPIMTIILAVTYEIRASGGKRSINWVSGPTLLFLFAVGLISFSKEGMLIGVTAWALTCIVNRYNFSRAQVASCVLGLSFVSYYLVPYSQYVRLFTSMDRAQNIATALHYLADLPETRRLYYAQISKYEISDEPHLFDDREGGLDRLIMLAPDDALVNYTAQGHVFGLTPFFFQYMNVVPHFIWPTKPILNFGNMYGHELSLIPEEDISTGVSFSMMADAYHQATWIGVIVLIPLQFFLAFIITDSLAGSARHAPWATLWLLQASHNASEGGMGIAVYMSTFAVLSVLLIIFTTKTVGPFVVNTLMGRKTRGRPGATPNIPQKPHLLPLPER